MSSPSTTAASSATVLPAEGEGTPKPLGGQITNDDLRVLISDPTKCVTQGSWNTFIKVSLHQLSPFKISTEQMTSIADFEETPWPKQGDAVDSTFDDLIKDLDTTTLSKGMSVFEAVGFMTIMAACYAAIRNKMSTLLSQQGYGDLIKSLQWNWDDQAPPSEDKWMATLRDRTQEWSGHIIDILLATRREDFEDTLTPDLLGPEHEGLLKTTFVNAIGMFATQARSISTQSARPKTKLSTSASSGEQGREWSFAS